tara:strand:+ start:14427 stop:16667 length:2241 start_codon:yes stop_codon:yes gene_type:complete
MTLDELQKEAEVLGAQKEAYDRETDDYTLRKIRSNLFFDDETRVQFLANQRFPNEDKPTDRYFNQDGTLFYMDDYGKFQKEFPDNDVVGFFKGTVAPNLVPAATFAADVGGGMYGAKKGFQIGQNLPIPNPIVKGGATLVTTGLGGLIGTFLSGGTARLGREGLINTFYNTPPEELSAMMDDLEVSSLFGAIPFGQGATRGLINKFRGKEDSLTYLTKLKGDVDKIIQDAKKQFGIDLTVAEAGEIGSRAGKIQRFLAEQPTIEKFSKFYADRASQVKEAIEVFADKIGGSGKVFGDTPTAVANKMGEVVEELTKRRKTRAGKFYNKLKDAGYIKVDGIENIVKQIDDAMSSVKSPSADTIKNFEKFKKMFYNADGKLVDDLMSLDARRTTEMRKLASKLTKAGTGDGAAMFGIMDDLAHLMDETEPLYNLARRIYDPNKPALQLVAKSAIGKYAKFVTDKKAANALKDVFDPNVSARSLRNTKRILQAVDPELYKLAKKDFLLSQLTRFSKEAQLEGGLPRFQAHFSQKNVKDAMKVMLEPEEFASFYKLNDYLGKAFSIQKGGSPTQPFFAMGVELANEVPKGLLRGGLEAGTAIQRFLRNVVTLNMGDDIAQSIALRQNEVYYNKLADYLLTGQPIEDVIKVFDTYGYTKAQGLIRGADEAVDYISDDDDVNYRDERIKNEVREELEALENQQSINMAPQVNVPIFDVPEINSTERMSPSILPNEKDREIAIRDVSQGIGSLV